ncbi:MAG: 4Fe-4S dicluster domain-containing protein [Deltaproteobacteria bacterium]|nr:4Fe-4S dicluster domain-containing protein [Deltaproteobacteria bacterium]
MKHRWAMAIDLDRCTGCGACVVACTAENNIPVIGEEEAAKGRLMHWIRVNRYWEEENPGARATYLPVPCQHCQRAPCEIVCPVYATYHSEDGLNAMVYNRCIGTRYCSNNCPYSVRVFNWYDYRWEKPLDEQLSPDLSVRSRGVMEKCTFCIQRIRRVKDKAAGEGRKIRDGEVQPACVQTCPPGALIFGDLEDPDSAISRLFKDPRRFRLFEHLGTEPHVVYLKRRKGAGA